MNWKAIGIIFIVISILQAATIGYFFYLGDKAIREESECMISCVDNEECFSYYYDDYDGNCYLMDTDGEILEIFKGG